MLFAGTWPTQWQGPDSCARHSHVFFPIFAVTMWCAWNCRGAREMNIQYMAQAVFFDQKFDDFLNDSLGSVWCIWSKAGFWQTQNQGTRWFRGCQSTQSIPKLSVLFLFWWVLRISKLDLQVFGVRRCEKLGRFMWLFSISHSCAWLDQDDMPYSAFCFLACFTDLGSPFASRDRKKEKSLTLGAFMRKHSEGVALATKITLGRQTVKHTTQRHRRKQINQKTWAQSVTIE